MVRISIPRALGLLLMTGLMAGSSCDGLQLNIKFSIPHQARSSATQKVDMPAGATLLVNNDVGSTRVTVDPAATQATVEITRIASADTQAAADDLLAKIIVTVTPPAAPDNVLKIDAPKPAEASDKSSDFQIVTTDDEVTVVSITNSVLVATVQLRITLPPSHASTVNQKTGSVRGVALDTDSSLNTTTGSVHTISCEAKITAATDVGSIDIAAHRGALDLTTHVGSMEAELLDLTAAESILARAETGSIQLTLPKGVDADLEALTEQGSIDFSKRRFTATSNVVQTHNTLSATLNDGGASIDLRTEFGSIEIDSR